MRSYGSMNPAHTRSAEAYTSGGVAPILFDVARCNDERSIHPGHDGGIVAVAGTDEVADAIHRNRRGHVGPDLDWLVGQGTGGARSGWVVVNDSHVRLIACARWWDGIVGIGWIAAGRVLVRVLHHLALDDEATQGLG